PTLSSVCSLFFFQAEDGIRDFHVTGVQTCALPISSFLVPRAYGVMHRMHHTFSDTEEDPHSPHFFKDIWQMMMHTAAIYSAFIKIGRASCRERVQFSVCAVVL